MTGSDPLVQVRLDYGEILESPPGWPLLPPPLPGEPMTDYLARAILEDPFFQEVEIRCKRARAQPTSLCAVRPALCTLEWWEGKYRKRRFEPPWQMVFPNEWRAEMLEVRELLFWRLMAAALEQVRTGSIRAQGRRIDVVDGAPKVPIELWINPDMLLLHPNTFRPQQRHGHPPPGSGLPSYIGLTLWPAKMNETKQQARPRLPYHELWCWWTTVYLPQHPDPDKRPNVAAQRAAAAAAFPDYAPPTARTMQNLRADKATPPEWREEGRRPSSGKSDGKSE